MLRDYVIAHDKKRHAALLIRKAAKKTSDGNLELE